MCDFWPWQWDFHKACPRSSWAQKFTSSPWLHPHQADAALGRDAGGRPPEEWARLLILVSWHVSIWECSAAVHSHTGMNSTHTLVWNTCIQHAQKSSNAGKGSILYICFTGKYIKKCVVNITAKDKTSHRKSQMKIRGNCRAKGDCQQAGLGFASELSATTSGLYLARLKWLLTAWSNHVYICGSRTS